MGFNIPEYRPIPTVGNAVPQWPEGPGTSASVLTSTPRPEGGSCLHSSDPTHNKGKVQILNLFAGMTGQLTSQQVDKEPSSVQTLGKGGKKKTSQGAQANTQPQPGTSSNPFPRNSSTGRSQVHYSACGGNDHLRKDYQQDNYCTKCRLKSHATSMCQASVKQGKNNNICIYCGSKNHMPGNCTNRPNDNREEPRSTPRDLQNNGSRIETQIQITDSFKLTWTMISQQ